MQISHNDLNEVLVAAENDLRALKGARVFLTGGTGYIGHWLLNSLLHADAALDLRLAVTVLSRNPKSFAEQCPLLADHDSVQMVEGDIRTFSAPLGQYTHVIHGATDVIAQQAPIETFDVTVAGTRKVLEFARSRGAQKVLIMSSGAVYGRIPRTIDRIPEDCVGSLSSETPASAYGIGKLASEWLGTVFSEPGVMSCSSARIFAQIGPKLALDKQFAAGNFLLNALRDEPFVIKGDGTPRRSYMYATDLVAWLLAILIRGHAGRAYNVGSDHGVSIRELAEAIARETGQSSDRIQVLGQAALGAAPDRYVPDISRAANELAARISVPLDEAIRRTYNWYRSHQR
ncbi:NAD(P)-dependent oxidoreductase [Paraburkholderia sp. C35]|uniref:NAD-dependent epimerase/dehydratase family protein n=1 Tax=Paraburkholderia sp. C35 TaxID=2126993 RepID=UPI000D69342B|nr:NAD(P)-dependent oxidoreductase [Paraburkholderia sp. C35]